MIFLFNKNRVFYGQNFSNLIFKDCDLKNSKLLILTEHGRVHNITIDKCTNIDQVFKYNADLMNDVVVNNITVKNSCFNYFIYYTTDVTQYAAQTYNNINLINNNITNGLIYLNKYNGKSSIVNWNLTDNNFTSSDYLFNMYKFKWNS